MCVLPCLRMCPQTSLLMLSCRPSTRIFHKNGMFKRPMSISPLSISGESAEANGEGNLLRTVQLPVGKREAIPSVPTPVSHTCSACCSAL